MSESVDKAMPEKPQESHGVQRFFAWAATMTTWLGGLLATDVVSTKAMDATATRFKEDVEKYLREDGDSRWAVIKKNLKRRADFKCWKSNTAEFVTVLAGAFLTVKAATFVLGALCPKADRWEPTAEPHTPRDPDPYTIAENRAETTSVQAAEHHGTVAATEKATALA